jgi:hypothetical protein
MNELGNCWDGGEAGWGLHPPDGGRLSVREGGEASIDGMRRGMQPFSYCRSGRSASQGEGDTKMVDAIGTTTKKGSEKGSVLGNG